MKGADSTSMLEILSILVIFNEKIPCFRWQSE